MIYRARENMQFKKVKKEIINYKKRDFAQTCRIYAKNRVFSANREKCCAKVNPDAKVLINFKICLSFLHLMLCCKMKFSKKKYQN